MTGRWEEIAQAKREQQNIVCPVCGMSTRLTALNITTSEVDVWCANPLCDSNLPPITERS